MSEPTAPGWYRTSPDASVERWYDGTQWTTLERPVDSTTDRARPVQPPVADAPTMSPTVMVTPSSAPEPPPTQQVPSPPPVPPSPTAAAGASPSTSPGMIGAIVVLAVALVGLLAGGIVLLAGGGEPDVAVAGTSVGNTTAPTAATVPPTVEPTAQPTVTEMPPPTPQPTVGCTDPDSSYWPTTTFGPVVECPSFPYGQPSVPLSTVSGPMVIVLESVDIDSPGLVKARVEEWRGRGFDAIAVDSRSLLGLRDPYLVVLVDGLGTEEDARGYCRARGYEPGALCYPRDPFVPSGR